MAAPLGIDPANRSRLHVALQTERMDCKRPDHLPAMEIFPLHSYTGSTNSIVADPRQPTPWVDTIVPCKSQGLFHVHTAAHGSGGRPGGRDARHRSLDAMAS